MASSNLSPSLGSMRWQGTYFTVSVLWENHIFYRISMPSANYIIPASSVRKKKQESITTDLSN